MNTAFGVRLLMNSLVVAVLVMAILIIKKLLKNQISLRAHYNIWLLFLVLLLVPFIPFKQAAYYSFPSWFTGLNSIAGQTTMTGSQNLPQDAPDTNKNWIQDFSISVSRITPSGLNSVILALWITGMVFMLIFTLYSTIKIQRLKHSALPLQDEKVKLIFKQCGLEAGLKNTIPIYSSAYLKSPVITGFFKPCILLPIHLISEFKKEDIRYILLHELQHFKYKDVQINVWMCLTRIIYWFHPMVWYALKEMRNDRELACDASVLRMLDEAHYTDYGNTLINFAEKLSYTSFSSAASMGDSKKQIKKRIINIASYQSESKWLKLKSLVVILITGALIFSFVPVMATVASDNNSYSFTGDYILDKEPETFFQDREGCFVLYDLSSNQYHIYNDTLSKERVSPNSTYKIYSALMALEEGVISPEVSGLKWDNILYSFASWNQDQDLDSAMKNSVNWYFMELDKRTGLPALKRNLKKLKYGNLDLSGGLSRYWLESTLKISPIEQVNLLISLYKNQSHFKPENIQAVKNALLLSGHGGASLYGKTGTGNINGRNVNGWFVGFIERADNTYFFATYIKGKDHCSGSTAVNLTLSILEQKKIYSSLN